LLLLSFVAFFHIHGTIEANESEEVFSGMDLILMLIVVFSASFSVFYSFKTRSYRKNGNFDMMKFYNAKANMSMGLMLVAMGSIQLFSFGADMTGWRMSIGIIFLALGLFNLYMGVRNYRTYLPKVVNKSD
jgi:hypothetical protein